MPLSRNPAPNLFRRLARLALAGGIFFLASCQPPVMVVDVANLHPTPTPTLSDVLATPAAEAIEEIPAAEPLAPISAPPEGGPGPTPASDPLRFVFPNSAPVPVSAWRPPLYPTPWAPTPYDHFFFARPIAADEINWPLPDYRYGGVFFGDIVHTGIDIPSPNGTNVLAAAPGKVTWAGFGLYTQSENLDDPYGLAVAIKHDFGYEGEALYTIYGHMSEIYVARGQRVEVGEKIGLVGETGKTTGPHLHFEVRIGRNNFLRSRNPELWLSPPQGWGVLAARITDSNGSLMLQQLIKIYTPDMKQKWEVMTYGEGAVVPDPYYGENMVIGDLPAGRYLVWIPYETFIQSHEVEIRAGMVTYFEFNGKTGFSDEPPATPAPDFTPPISTTLTLP